MIFAALVACTTAACGDIPQPFRHQGPPETLARPKLARGVTVRPPTETAAAQAMGDALVRALEDQEIAAQLSKGPAFGYVIQGSAEEIGTATTIRWTLTAPDGTTVTTQLQTIPTTVLAKANAAGLKQQTKDIAATLAQTLADPDAVARAEAKDSATVDSRPTIMVAPLRGLPGDGDKAMTSAIKRALDRGGLLVKDDGAAYMVEGKMTVAPGVAGEDILTVVWIIKRAEGGTQLGSIGQDGAVPRGRLSTPWGSLARDIAEGGAAGLLEVVKADTNAAARRGPQGGLQK